MRTLKSEIHYEQRQISKVIEEIQGFLESYPYHEFAIGEEIYTAADLLKTGAWKDNFSQWEEFHAINHPCDDTGFFSIEDLISIRRDHFNVWLAEQKEIFYRG